MQIIESKSISPDENNMKRQRILCLFGIPCMFFMTIFVLSIHLRPGAETTIIKKHRLVAAYSHRFESRIEKYSKSDKLFNEHPQDLIYDSAQLEMLGQIHSKEDEELKANGNCLSLKNYNLIVNINQCLKEASKC